MNDDLSSVAGLLYQFFLHYSKIFERCILNQLIFYCLTENILVPNQYGFRSGYNTTNCLVDLIDEITKALDEEKYAVSILFSRP